MGPHPRRFAIVATVLWLVSGLGGRAEAGIILQTPAGLNPGDQFRFVFVTDGSRDATSTNVADYDSFVNAEAGGATYNGVVVNWLAIGSTDSVDAIDHVGQAAAPVYLSDGTLVTTSTTAAGLWSRTLVHAISLDLAGNPVPPFTFVWTGTNPFGTGFGGPLGSATPQTGSPFDTFDSWVASGRSPGGDLRPLYGISSVLAVPQSVPEPSTLTMLGTALGAGLAITWARHRRVRRSVRHRKVDAFSRLANQVEK
jgi:PEP-CTERM motif